MRSLHVCLIERASGGLNWKCFCWIHQLSTNTSRSTLRIGAFHQCKVLQNWAKYSLWERESAGQNNTYISLKLWKRSMRFKAIVNKLCLHWILAQRYLQMTSASLDNILSVKIHILCCGLALFETRQFLAISPKTSSFWWNFERNLFDPLWKVQYFVPFCNVFHFRLSPTSRSCYNTAVHDKWTIQLINNFTTRTGTYFLRLVCSTNKTKSFT